MSVLSVGVRVPTFELHHRMALALETAGISVNDVAEYLGVDPSSVSRWLNGRVMPRRQTLLLWAMRTDVPLEWLETGQAPVNGPGPDASCAARDSNPEPASYESRVLPRLALLAILHVAAIGALTVDEAAA